MEPPVPLGSVEKATRYIIQRSHRPMADKAPKFARTPSVRSVRSARCLAPVGRPVSTWFASIRRRSSQCLAPLAGRFQPGLPALGGGLSGAWHLLGRGGPAWFASIGRRSVQCLAVCPVPGTCWPGGFNLVCQHWTAVYPVPGTAVYPVPGTCWGEAVQPGLPALGGGLSSAWRSVQCLAPVGRAVSTWFASIGRRSIRCLAPVGAGRFSLVCQHWTAGLSGAWHLLAGLSGAWHLLAGRFQHGLPALGGGLPGAWHLWPGGTFGRAVSAWFASIGRPVCPVPGTCWGRLALLGAS